MASKMVQIIELSTKEPIEEMGPMDESKAERVKRGIEINLNHDEYKVQLKDV